MNIDLQSDDAAGIPDPFPQGGRNLPPMLRPSGSSPTRAGVRVHRAAALLAALAYCAVGLLIFRVHGGARPVATLALSIAVPLSACALASAAALGRGNLGLGAPTARMASLSVLAMVTFVGATLIGAQGRLPPTTESEFFRHLARCMLTSGAFALGPALLTVRVFRHVFASAPGWHGGALGLACGSLAATMMGLVCPDTGALHVLLGHGAILLITGAAGWALGRWALA